MSFLTRHVWLATFAISAALCVLFALLFYPRAIDLEERLAHAKQRDAAYDLLSDGVTAELEGDDTLARQKYESALELDPTLSRGHLALGQLELEEGNLEKAREHFETSVDLFENQADTYNNLGVVQWRLGDRRGAIRQFDRAIGLNPLFNRARTNRGLARLLSGDLHGAEEDFEAAIADTVRPTQVQRAVVGLGIVHALEGRHEQAVDSLSIVAALTHNQAPLALYNRAQVYEAMGNVEAAERDRAAARALEQELENTAGRDPAPDDEA